MGRLIPLVVVLSAAVMVSALTPITDSNIKTASYLWRDNKIQCIGKYGHVSDWDTAEVTDMDSLFYNRGGFNEDLFKWNVGKVTNMRKMFSLDATSFTSDLSKWDVSKVTRMDDMFEGATSFTSDLSKWDVSKVTTMGGMFEGATSFNSDLSKWNVGSVESMRGMFEGATSFNADLSKWNVDKVTSMSSMFSGATSFTSDLSEWNVGENFTEYTQIWTGGKIIYNSHACDFRPSRVLPLCRSMFNGANSFNCSQAPLDFVCDISNNNGGLSSKTGVMVGGIVGGLIVVLLAGI